MISKEEVGESMTEARGWGDEEGVGRELRASSTGKLKAADSPGASGRHTPCQHLGFVLVNAIWGFWPPEL